MRYTRVMGNLGGEKSTVANQIRGVSSYLIQAVRLAWHVATSESATWFMTLYKVWRRTRVSSSKETVSK